MSQFLEHVKLITWILTYWKCVEFILMMSAFSGCKIFVSRYNGNVNKAAAINTASKFDNATLQGFELCRELWYSTGCRIAKYLCLAIKIVMKIDEKSINCFNGCRTYENKIIDQSVNVCSWSSFSHSDQNVSYKMLQKM